MINEISNTPSKEIVSLTDVEHVLILPAMYVGSIEPIDENIRIIKNGTIENVSKPISIGFYKLMNEILDNAFDEAKRMNGAMSTISISFDTSSKKVTVVDSGNGFLNGTAINKKTGMSNIETAMTMLRAGSNFKNKEIENTLLGTHGIGASVVNMLSDRFEIHTINDTDNYKQVWEQFKSVSKQVVAKQRGDKRGTTISFIPREKYFKDCNWDFEFIEAQMIFKEYIRKNDPVLNKIKFDVYFDDVKIDLSKQFIPKENYTIDSKIGQFIIWEHLDNGTKNTSFINTAMCTGIHQTILNDVINELLDYKSGHYYYDIFFVMNLPPKHVRFGDQNKTKYAPGRWEIQPIMEKHFLKELQKVFPKTDIFKRIKQKIKESTDREDIQILKKALRNKSKKIISDKYFPPTDKKGTLFIVEGDCVDANEKINIWRNGELLNIKLKDLMYNDETLTHKNRYKRILNVQRKLKEVVTIATNIGSFKCGLSHPLYIYDTVEKTFDFIIASKLDLNIHKLVKNSLSNCIGTVEVIKKELMNDKKFKIRLILENGEIYDNSETHKYCVYDEDTMEFNMIESKNINIGNLIAVFDNL